MPDGILPNEGIGDQLEYILKRDISGVLPWRMFLWVNDIEPDADTVLADLEEASFPGYFSFDMTRDAWTVPEVADGCATSTWGESVVSWFVEGPTDETVFGWAMIDLTANVIRYIQRFDEEDIAPLEVGAEFRFLPTYTLTSAACEGT